LVNEIIGPVDAYILCPAFLEGGRVTVNDVHYVREKELLVPVADTPFAADKAFGFRSSNVLEWVIEKYQQNNQKAPQLASISLEDLRRPDAVSYIAANLQRLLASRNSSKDRYPQVIVLNAFNHNDLKIFIAARARMKTTVFIYRSGASLVSAYLGITPSLPLSPQEIFKHSGESGRGGLIIVGSYVPKTTAQLQYLLRKCGGTSKHIELQVDQILASQDSGMGIARTAAHLADVHLAEGTDVIISTSRTLVSDDDPAKSLIKGQKISDELCEITRRIEVRPRYVIAKVSLPSLQELTDLIRRQGGITSSDIATSGLGMRRATVIGQAAPGIPIWQSSADSSSKWSGTPYVVFPGNTGEETTLGDIVWSFQSR
jgi:uncharacterized protein YgbK (DUF1537 family)